MIEALTSRAGIFAILAVVAGLAMRSEAIVAVLLPALKDFNLIRKSLEQNLSNPSESWMGKLVHMLMVSVNGPASIELVTRMDLKPGETAMEVCFGPGEHGGSTHFSSVSTDVHACLSHQTHAPPPGIGLEEALLYEGVHLIGVDISPEMHRRAARRAAVAAGIGEGRVELINTPVHNLQGVKDNSVDKVRGASSDMWGKRGIASPARAHTLTAQLSRCSASTVHTFGTRSTSRCGSSTGS